MFGGQNVMQIFSTSKMYKLCWASSRATLVFNQKCAAEHPGLHLWQAWAIPHQAAADWWRETPQSHKTEIFYTTSTATLIQYSCATMNAAGSAPQGSSSTSIYCSASRSPLPLLLHWRRGDALQRENVASSARQTTSGSARWRIM